ncbi:hypothetical protein AB0P21_14480 [Kribbella sp. NPDC056861]|uniref:hypothetical protein n=1 Tax=Kribbella sp. NPDC056861 TaxID=3154857 RepID=UPI00344290E6
MTAPAGKLIRYAGPGWIGESLGERMAVSSEYRLLNALSETTPYSVPELAESAGLSAPQVERLIQPLAADGRLTVQWQDGRAEYRLSPAGVVQRVIMRNLVRDGPVKMGDVINAFSAAEHQSGIAAHREQMAEVPLTDHERTVCADALTWQHQRSRFDWSDLSRRRALLNAAVTHGDLAAVFDGLQLPPLYGEQSAAPAGVSWNKIGYGLRLLYGLRVLFCLPFLVAGIFVLSEASGPKGYFGGAILIGGAAFCAYPVARRAFGRSPR